MLSDRKKDLQSTLSQLQDSRSATVGGGMLARVVDISNCTGHSLDMSHDEVAARWEALGLFDPSAPNADSTLEMLAFYDSTGVDPADFVGTSAEDLVPQINLHQLDPGRRVDRQTAEASTGLTPDQFTNISRAAGFDPDGAFSPLDIAAFRGFADATMLFSEAEVESLVRVMRSLMGHLADALTSMFRIDISVPMDVAGASDLDFAKKNYESAQLLPSVPPALEALLKNEMTSAIVRSDQGRQQLDPTSNTATLKMAVGFVDIVGYTPIADRLEPDELGQFIIDFERRASDAVIAGGGRVVKLIGDEIMFVVADPNAAMTIAASLIEAFEGSEATPRGGVVFGEIVARGGDYYGRLVNMASRVADLAVPGEILTDIPTAEAASFHQFDHAGRRTLKGFAAPVELRSLQLT